VHERQDVTVNGIRLACEVSGAPEAPPMVLLHGLGEGRVSWAPVIPRFSERFRVVAPDLRGHGDSDWPGSYSFQLIRDDVLGLLDQLGFDKVTLVGHSMGASVAYLAVLREPSRIERLIIEDAPPPYPRDRAIPDRPGGALDFDWPVVPAIGGQVNAGDPETWASLPMITAPTLLIGGGPDSHVSQDKLAEAAARIPHSELVTIPAGHQVHVSRPAEFTRAVLSWLPASAIPPRGAAGTPGSAG
jgi:3-oxoadipate enol-lactonase